MQFLTFLIFVSFKKSTIFKSEIHSEYFFQAKMVLCGIKNKKTFIFLLAIVRV